MFNIFSFFPYLKTLGSNISKVIAKQIHIGCIFQNIKYFTPKTPGILLTLDLNVYHYYFNCTINIFYKTKKLGENHYIFRQDDFDACV